MSVTILMFKQRQISIRRGIAFRTTLMHGFSMVEVLVALVVLAIGLLGLAGLQATGLRYSGNSALRSQALILSQDIVERMRANPTGVAANNYTASTLPTAYSADCSATTCSASALATFDLVNLKSTIDNRLPAGATATIATTVNSPSTGIHTVVITLNWSERVTEGGGSTNQILTTTTQL